MDSPRTPTDDRSQSPSDDPKDSDRRAAGTVFTVMLGALLLSALMNADTMLARAESGELGWRRDLSLAFWRPIETASSTVGLGGPRNGLDALQDLDRSGPAPPSPGGSRSLSPSPHLAGPTSQDSAPAGPSDTAPVADPPGADTPSASTAPSDTAPDADPPGADTPSASTAPSDTASGDPPGADVPSANTAPVADPPGADTPSASTAPSDTASGDPAAVAIENAGDDRAGDVGQAVGGTVADRRESSRASPTASTLGHQAASVAPGRGERATGNAEATNERTAAPESATPPITGLLSPTRPGLPGLPPLGTVRRDAEPNFALRRPTADDPLRLLIVGDSTLDAVGSSMLRELAATGVTSAVLDFRVSSGLSRPDFFDWPAHLGDLTPQLEPEIVVIMLGANDAQAFAVDNQVVDYGTERWFSTYRARVTAVLDQLTADGRWVVWIGQPVMRKGAFDAKMRQINQLFVEEVARYPTATFVDSRAVTVDEAGGYAAYLADEGGAPRQVRQDDGIHLTAAGGDRLAPVVIAAVNEIAPLF